MTGNVMKRQLPMGESASLWERGHLARFVGFVADGTPALPGKTPRPLPPSSATKNLFGNLQKVKLI
jgi:hypothetical protein